MRTRFPIAVCTLFWCFAAAAHQVEVTPQGDLKHPRTPGEEREFRDPFATEAEMKGKVSDPLEPVNRAFFHFNDKLYFWVLRPAAKAYRKVAPAEFRVSIRNFFHNLRFPVRGANNLLQGKFKRAGIETGRFMVNTTVGIGGLFDPAQDEWRLVPYVEDFDQTLGYYRVPTGFYLSWPLFGPSSVRGTAGQLVDNLFYVSPWAYLDTPGLSLGVRSFETVNATSLRLGDYEDFKKAAFDPYVSLRDAYFENRHSLVNE